MVEVLLAHGADIEALPKHVATAYTDAECRTIAAARSRGDRHVDMVCETRQYRIFLKLETADVKAKRFASSEAGQIANMPVGSPTGMAQTNVATGAIEIVDEAPTPHPQTGEATFVHFPVSYGRSALFHACNNGQSKVVGVLIAAGAKLEVADSYGYNPFLVAAKHGHADVIALLAKAGANVSARLRVNMPGHGGGGGGGGRVNGGPSAQVKQADGVSIALQSTFKETLAAITQGSPTLAKRVLGDKGCPGWARDIAAAALFPSLSAKDQKSKARQLFGFMKSDNMALSLTAIASFGKLSEAERQREHNRKDFVGVLLHHYRLHEDAVGATANASWQWRGGAHRSEGQWARMTEVDQANFEMKWLKASLRSGPSELDLHASFDKGNSAASELVGQQGLAHEALLWAVNFESMTAKPKLGGSLKQLRRVPPPFEQFLSTFSETAFWECGSNVGSSTNRPFVALGSRDVLAWAREEMKPWQDSTAGIAKIGGWSVARKLSTAKAAAEKATHISKLFIKVQSRLAKAHVAMLRTVVVSQGSKHLISFRQTLDGIRHEPNFERYCSMAQTAAESVASRHASATLQQKHRVAEGLFSAAMSVSGRYRQFVKRLAHATGGEHIDVAMKGMVRVLEKTGLRPDRKRQWETEHVFDVVRGGLEFDSTAKGCEMLEFVLACDAQEAARSGKGELAEILAGPNNSAESIQIVRIKNRFFEPTPGGWADTMINFFFTEDANQHICEIQLVHSQMMTVRKAQGAHRAYTQTRTAQELLEAIGEADDLDAPALPTVALTPAPSGERGGGGGGGGGGGAARHSSSTERTWSVGSAAASSVNGGRGGGADGGGAFLLGDVDDANGTYDAVMRERSGSADAGQHVSRQPSYDFRAHKEIETLKAKFALLEESVSVSSGSSYGSFVGRAGSGSSVRGRSACAGSYGGEAAADFGRDSFKSLRADSAPSEQNYFNARRSVSVDSLIGAAGPIDVPWRDLVPRLPSARADGRAATQARPASVASDTNPFKQHTNPFAQSLPKSELKSAAPAEPQVEEPDPAARAFPPQPAVTRGEFERMGALVSSLYGTVTLQNRKIESLMRLVRHLQDGTDSQNRDHHHDHDHGVDERGALGRSGTAVPQAPPNDVAALTDYEV